MGPNIKPFPRNEAPFGDIIARVTLHAGDNITTDDIMPSDSRLLPYRSNVPHLANYCFEKIDPEFAARCKDAGQCVIIGGENYGQGSSREHAAINPMYLGVKCVIAKSIARIHKGNLVNHGIIPMLFEDPAAYDSIDQGDELRIENLLDQIPTRRVTVKDVTKHFAFTVKLDLTDNEIEVVLAGGQLRFLKKQLENK
jgi:aconitate hydratase